MNREFTYQDLPRGTRLRIIVSYIGACFKGFAKVRALRASGWPGDRIEVDYQFHVRVETRNKMEEKPVVKQ